MSWDRCKEAIDIILKAQIHAIFLVFIGAALALHGNKDEGMLVLGGALAMLKSPHPQS